MKALRVPNPKPFVLKILVFKFFESNILRDPFFKTRAGQGFQRYREKKFKQESGSEADPLEMGDSGPNFISLRYPQERTPARPMPRQRPARIRAQGRASSPSAVARSYDARRPHGDCAYGRVFAPLTGKTSDSGFEAPVGEVTLWPARKHEPASTPDPPANADQRSANRWAARFS